MEGIQKQKGSKSNIAVGIRIRPPLPREIKDGKMTSAVSSKKNRIYVSLSGKPVVVTSDQAQIEGMEAYQFDQVFDLNSTQADVYNHMVAPSVRSVVNSGINATIFAYGQTGSGKTYTMQGDERNNLDPEKGGMIPRAVIQIFDELRKN